MMSVRPGECFRGGDTESLPKRYGGGGGFGGREMSLVEGAAGQTHENTRGNGMLRNPEVVRYGGEERAESRG